MIQLHSKAHDNSYAEVAIEQLNSHQLCRTPEGVAIWIAANKSFPTMKLPHDIWHQNDPLNARDKRTLARVMKEASVTDHQTAAKAEQGAQKGSWNSRLHFAWSVVLAEFYSTNEQLEWSHKNKKSKRINFVEFWDTVVDGQRVIYFFVS
jgi:DNA polymerase phi